MNRIAAHARACTLSRFDVDPRRARASDDVSVREAGVARTAEHPPSPRSTLSNAHPRLLAEGHARGALPELAAGSAVELHRAARLPGEDHRARRARGPRRRDGRDEPL